MWKCRECGKEFKRKDKIRILKHILIVLNMSAIFVIRSTREETLCRATSIKSIKKRKWRLNDLKTESTSDVSGLVVICRIAENEQQDRFTQRNISEVIQAGFVIGLTLQDLPSCCKNQEVNHCTAPQSASPSCQTHISTQCGKPRTWLWTSSLTGWLLADPSLLHCCFLV